MPDPSHWLRTLWRTDPPPPDDDHEEPGTLVGVPEPPPWLDDPDWHDDKDADRDDG
jgi:hypothetical protein